MSGGGVLWSEQFTKEWLSQHKLGCLIRSHECQDEGYKTHHEGRVLTLFSASNYYGEDEEMTGLCSCCPLCKTRKVSC